MPYECWQTNFSPLPMVQLTPTAAEKMGLKKVDTRAFLVKAVLSVFTNKFVLYVHRMLSRNEVGTFSF